MPHLRQSGQLRGNDLRAPTSEDGCPRARREPEPEKADWYIHGQTVATPDWGGTPMESAIISAYRASNVEVGPTRSSSSRTTRRSGSAPTPRWPAATANTCTIGTAFAVSANKVNAVITEAEPRDYWLLLPEAGRAYVMAAGEKPRICRRDVGPGGQHLRMRGDLGDREVSEQGGYFVRRASC